MTTKMERLETNVRAARTRHAREQHRGLTDMSVQQTRRMALAVANLQKHEGALAREVRSQQVTAMRADDDNLEQALIDQEEDKRHGLRLIRGGRA